MSLSTTIWEFPKIGVPYLGVLIIRILLFRVLYQGPLFSETPIYIDYANGPCMPSGKHDEDHEDAARSQNLKP